MNDLMKLAQEIGVQYLDTVVEPWPGFYFGSTLPNAERTNYPLRERVRELGKAYVGGPTAVAWRRTTACTSNSVP